MPRNLGPAANTSGWGGEPTIVVPSTPWWSSAASNQALAANTDTEIVPTAGGNSRITLTNSTNVAQTWLVMAGALLRATTANWTPIFFYVDLNNGATLVERIQARGSSNTGAGNDWTTLTIPPWPVTVPANSTRLLIPKAQAARFAGSVNRDTSFARFLAMRVTT